MKAHAENSHFLIGTAKKTQKRDREKKVKKRAQVALIGEFAPLKVNHRVNGAEN